MSEREERRAALARRARKGMSSFLLLDPTAVFARRDDVLKAVAPAKRLGGRTSVLIERLEEADRANKFVKALNVLKRHLTDVSSSRTSSARATPPRKKTPRLRPHEQSASA